MSVISETESESLLPEIYFILLRGYHKYSEKNLLKILGLEGYLGTQSC